MSQHTPGPWYYEAKPEGGYQICYGSNDPASSDGWIADIGDANGEADARLIAAAPDLLAALQMILRRWTFNSNQQHTHTWHDWADCMALARPAIAEATETPS